MQTVNFTADNIGSPDAYTVKTVCRSIQIEEGDRTVATLAQYRVYLPDEIIGTSKSRKGGEQFVISAPGQFFYPGDKPFKVETVNVAAAVLSITEE